MAVGLEEAVQAVYESRLSQWARRADDRERAHRRMGNLRFLFAAGVVALAVVLAQTRVGVGLAFSIIVFGLFVSGKLHDRILKARDGARRAVGFYQAGLD